MSLPRYPRYKDSGVEWLGEVPENWETRRLRFVAEINPSKSETSELDRESLVSFLPMEAIGEDGTLDLDREKTLREVETGYTFFRDGDVALAKITPCFENGKRALMAGLKNGVGFGTTELIVARPFPNRTTGNYLYRVFSSEPFMKLGEAEMYGAGGQKRVPDSFVRNFATSFPPIEEQHKIARALDQETAKIEALVWEQRRLIELLKEKRQAVISHAVTKGLNPDAPMKDSGVAWLGEVPTHWSVTPIGHLCTHISYGFTNPMPETEEGPYMLTANDVDYGRIRYETARRTSSEAWLKALTDKSRPQEGDILITKDGTLGRVAVHDGQLACINQSVASLRVKEQSVKPAFMAICLQGSLYQARMIYEAGGTTIKHIYISRLTKMPVAYPSLPEQDSILSKLSEALIEFNTLIGEATRTIDLLQERRTALISAAVTGKIDVRGLATEDAA
jgi:type I restriction enzyme S subunit